MPAGWDVREGRELFSRLQVVAMGLHGAFYVADNREPAIRVFEPTGDVRTRYGRRDNRLIRVMRKRVDLL